MGSCMGNRLKPANITQKGLSLDLNGGVRFSCNNPNFYPHFLAPRKHKRVTLTCVLASGDEPRHGMQAARLGHYI